MLRMYSMVDHDLLPSHAQVGHGEEDAGEVVHSQWHERGPGGVGGVWNFQAAAPDSFGRDYRSLKSWSDMMKERRAFGLCILYI
mmetsp:Transcript_52450/g.157335  ORF Transcript_52450/g.157335 Transcript_52450/m.157335 type:complete len:84 (+) Transcript_52450:677-928(+)